MEIDQNSQILGKLKKIKLVKPTFITTCLELKDENISFDRYISVIEFYGYIDGNFDKKYWWDRN